MIATIINVGFASLVCVGLYYAVKALIQRARTKGHQHTWQRLGETNTRPAMLLDVCTGKHCGLERTTNPVSGAITYWGRGTWRPE